MTCWSGLAQPQNACSWADQGQLLVGTRAGAGSGISSLRPGTEHYWSDWQAGREPGAAGGGWLPGQLAGTAGVPGCGACLGPGCAVDCAPEQGPHVAAGVVVAA